MPTSVTLQIVCRFDDYVDRIPETWRANSELGVERASVEQLVDHMGVARGGDG